MPTIKNKFFRAIRSEHLYDQKVFRVIVFVSSFLAIIVWWGVQSSVQQNIDARLENEVNRIESGVRGRLAIYENSLRFLRVFFQLSDERAFQSYQELIQAADIQNRYPGIRGVGVAALVKKKDIRYHTYRQKMLHKDKYELQPPGVRDYYAPVVAFEPMTDYSPAFFGTDLLVEPLRSSVIRRAIDSGQVEMSEPIEFKMNHQIYGRSGFLLLLPFFSQNKVPETVEKRQAKAIGILYMPIRPQVFFEGILGPPDLKSEVVNFEVSSASPATHDSSVYSRFGQGQPLGYHVKTRIIDLNGSKWLLRVTTLPHFYNFSDKWAPTIVALIEVLLISLVMVVFRLMFNQLINEKNAKEIMRESERNSQVYAKQLRLLNAMSQEISAELEVEKMADHFFQSLTEISEASHSLLYLSSRGEEPFQLLNATHFKSVEMQDVRRPSVSSKVVGELFCNNDMIIRKMSEGSQHAFEYFFNIPDVFTDWMFVIVPSREQGASAVFFMAKDTGEKFSENVLEIVDSLVSQFATSIENANLLKKTEDSNKAKSQFLANMSHEIRTPLNAIIGFSEMSMIEQEKIKKQELLDGIRKNGQQLTRLIDDILDISKVEAGKLQIVKKPVSLQALLNEVKTVMVDRANAKGIQFIIDWEQEVPSVIETDELRLKQIIFNVVGNAIKFTEKGSVRLSVSAQRSPSGIEIKFLVKDTGIGMSGRDQIKLFRPFQQGDSSSTRRFGGTGLGLALSKKLAAELGGDLFLVSSLLDYGSEFCIVVNAGALQVEKYLSEEMESPVVASDNVEPQEQVQSLKEANILVVEDSEDNQEIFEYFLCAAGAKVEMVADGLTAVDRAQAMAFDLILMDIQLPSIDGKEATRRIRRNGFKNPIVALTAHAMPEERESCLRAGCNGQISKPVSGVSLVMQVAEFLHANREKLQEDKQTVT